MSLDKKEYEKENQYLGKVILNINNELNERSGYYEKASKEIKEIKRFMWQNKQELDGAEQQFFKREISEKIDNGDRAKRRYELLKRIKTSPYFGRIDFNNETFGELMKVYIGLTSIEKNDEIDFLVYDWRSPIASMYYECGKGKASYNAPRGIIDGELTLKRQYKIENAEIKYVFDNDINIDDELLKEALSKNTNEKMKNVVNSIQKEQNEIIRNEKDEVLIVQGPAGSGKTSVALHRIAYLLYKERETLSEDDVLIFSPNEIFSEYISNVLPELGEANVLQTTFSDYAKNFLTEYKKIENFTEQIENIYEKQEDNQVRNDSIKIKMNPIFKKILDEYIDQIEKNIKFKDLKINNKIIILKAEFEKLYNEDYKNYEIEKRINKIVERAVMIYDDGNLKESQKEIIKQNLILQINKKLDIKQIYKDLYRDEQLQDKMKNVFYIQNIKNICEHTLKKLQSDKITYEDVVCLLYLKGKITGFFETGDIKHVVIDEAQDYSILQYEILKNIFKKSKFTILGDVNQAINPYLNYNDFSLVEQIFNNKSTKILKLINCYRTSYEITNLTNDLLKIKNANPMKRKEGLPQIIKGMKKEDIFENMKKDIKEMKDKGYNQIGIICKTAKDIKEVYEAIKNDTETVNCILSENNEYGKGITILPSYFSKGLEFDGVIAYCSKENNYKEENEKKLLYVVCTRPLHKLKIYNESKDIDLTDEIDNNLYDNVKN